MNRNSYEALVLEVIHFAEEDVITTSGDNKIPDDQMVK